MELIVLSSLIPILHSLITEMKKLLLLSLLPALVYLGPVAPISVNFNHELAYFADHSDTTHVRHQPTAVA